MAVIEVITNGLLVTASSAYNAGVTAITVNPPTGGPAIPSLAAGQQMHCVWDGEIILVTGSSGSGNVNWTITRGQEGTTAVSHLVNSQIIQISSVAGIAQTVVDNSAVVLIASVTTSGSQATVTFNNISGVFSALRIEYQCRSTAAVSTTGLSLEINADATAAHYTSAAYMLGGGGAGQGVVASSTVGSFVNNIPGSSVTAGYVAAGSIRLNAYAGTTFDKRFNHSGAYAQTGNSDIVLQSSGLWLSTAAITRLDFTLSSGNFVDGSTFVLYGER